MVNAYKHEIKHDVMEFLGKCGCTEVPLDHVFLVDSDHMQLFDGPAFNRRILRLLTGNKLPHLFE